MPGSFRLMPRVYADSTGRGAAWRPAWENVQARVREGECPSEREWYLLGLENGLSDERALGGARELAAAVDAYRAEVQAEAASDDVASLLRAFRIGE